jgi:DMATS type aromatic prenyltransferase
VVRLSLADGGDALTTAAAKLAHSAETLAGQAERKLAALAAAFGLGGRCEEIRGCLVDLLGPHGARPIDAPPAWPSDICDDHGPFEFSVSLNRRQTALRILVETGGASPSFEDLQAAGEAKTAALAAGFGVPLDRLRGIEDLFRGAAPPASLARWHAVAFEGADPPAVKVYLNPQIGGPAESGERVAAALSRLGLDDAWPMLQRVLARDAADELKYFGLDLSADRHARVKIYVRHHGISAPELESTLDGCRGYSAGEASDFCRHMTGGEERYDRKPIITCFSWIQGESRPAATLHVPIRGYARDDQVASDRICAYLRSQGISTAAYEIGIPAFAGRQLDAGIGLQSYASLKRTADGANVTVYLVPETYCVQPPTALVPQLVPAEVQAP